MKSLSLSNKEDAKLKLTSLLLRLLSVRALPSPLTPKNLINWITKWKKWTKLKISRSRHPISAIKTSLSMSIALFQTHSATSCKTWVMSQIPMTWARWLRLWTLQMGRRMAHQRPCELLADLGGWPLGSPWCPSPLQLMNTAKHFWLQSYFLPLLSLLLIMTSYWRYYFSGASLAKLYSKRYHLSS